MSETLVQAGHSARKRRTDKESAVQRDDVGFGDG